MTLIAEALIAVALGTAIGIVTGLLPGLHVNTVAPLVLGATTVGLGGGTFAAMLLFSVAVVHTIVNVIPTLAAPVPDDDTALMLQPIQQMARAGHAVQALRLSVRASGVGGLVAGIVAIVVLFAWPFGAPKVPARLAVMAVLGILAMLVLKQARPGRALVVLLLAGFAGVMLLPVSIVGPLGGDGTVLLPAFAGFFGLPMLLLALMAPPSDAAEVPAAEGSVAVSRWATTTGTFCGILVALFPGLTSATAGSFGRSLRKPASDAEDVVMLSAVDTANVVGNTAALLVWGATRSGASAAAETALPDAAGAAAGLLSAVMVAVLVASVTIGAWVTLGFGPRLVTTLRRLPPRGVAIGGIVLLTVIVAVHSGPLGLLVAVLLTPLGLLPHRWESPRALLMGFLLVPYLASVASTTAVA